MPAKPQAKSAKKRASKGGSSKTRALAAESERDDHLERAEEIVDMLTEKTANYAGKVGHELTRLTARFREDLEDIWAEAQAIRQRDDNS